MTRTCSVAVPTHRPVAGHLAALRTSVEDQRVPDGWSIELVVTDDRDPHLGMVGNWNRAVRATTGEAVLLLSQDDVVEPTMLATLLDALDRHPDAVVAAGGRTFIDDDGTPCGGHTNVNDRSAIWVTEDEYVIDHRLLTALVLRNGLAFAEPSAMVFRRTAFDAVDGFDARYEHNADLDFTLRITTAGPAVYRPEPLLRRRMHPGNLTHTHLRTGATLRDRERLLADHGGDLDPGIRRQVHAALTSRAARDAIRALAWRNPRLSLANLGSMARHAVPGAPALLPHLREIATGRNLDRR